MNFSKDRLVIYTSWQTYSLMLLLPLFLIVLDYVSARMTHTTFGSGILNVAVAIFLATLIFGSRILILSENTIKSWPSLIFGKKTLVNDISQIDVRVDTHFAPRAGGIVPVSTMYLINSNSKVLDKINLATFDTKSLALLLKKVALINPGIVLNDKAKELSGGEDALINTEIKEIYLSGIKVAVLILVLALLVFGIGHLLRQF